MLALTCATCDSCVVGVDFGTLSGRALVVRASDGEELGSAVHEYAHGVIDAALPRSGEKLPPSWALQDPDDWLDVLRNAVPAAVRAAGVDPADVVGIATDFTASTPLPVLADGTPLCRSRGSSCGRTPTPSCGGTTPRRSRPTGSRRWREARQEPWLARYGGRISSEWEFAKALQVLEEDPEIYAAIDRWIEAADWIVWQLCGVETRNACTAGYKGIFQDGRYPSEDYLGALNEGFAGFVAEKLEHPLSPLGGRAGSLTAQAAEWTGLNEGIAVAVGNVDAHVTAPAARAIEPGHMLAVMGTSTCHVMNGDRARRGAGHVRRRRRRHHARPARLRGRTERRRRHLRLVRRAAGAAGLPRRGRATRRQRASLPLRAGEPRRRSASTVSSRSTGTAATARCSSITSSAACSSASRSAPAPRTSTAR